MRVLGIIAFNIAAIAVIALGFEMIGHVYFPDVISKKTFGAQGVYPRRYYSQNEKRGFDISPDFRSTEFVFQDAAVEIFSNQFGCMDVDDSIDDDYVLLLGDSFAWGYAPFEQKFGSVLESLTDRRILKCGVPHTGQFHQLSKGKDVVSHVGKMPSVVVVSRFENDLLDDLLHPRSTVIDGYLVDQVEIVNGIVKRLTRGDLQNRYEAWLEDESSGGGVVGKGGGSLLAFRDFLKHNSFIANLVWAKLGVRRLIAPWREPALLSTDGLSLSTDRLRQEARAQNRIAILGLHDWAASMGSELLLVLIPTRALRCENHSDLMSFLRESSIAYLDVCPAFREESREDGAKLYWTVDNHTTPEGDLIIARLINDRIEPLLSGASGDETH